VAFILVHCFCLLESKFRFEFYLFESFPKFLSLFLFLFLFLSSSQPVPPFPAQQPAAAALRSGPAGRPSSRASQPARAPRQPAACSAFGPAPTRRARVAATAVADLWDPLVIPYLTATDQDSAAAAKSGPGTPSRVWPARQDRVPRAI
jgi:hypothetical protein